MIERRLKPLFVITGTVSLLMALGFATAQPWAADLWPWPEGRLSLLFIGSIAAAVGAPVLWIGLTGEFRAAAPGALNLIVAFGGAAGTLIVLYARQGTVRFLGYALVFALTALLCLAIWWWSRLLPRHDLRPLPVPVRYSFGLFAVLLVLVGGALVARAQYIFPWPLKPESSVIFGGVFLGAAIYFFHGVCWPSWSNAVGQLLGFLAYDLVLIGPFLGHFATVKTEHRTSLIIYCAVLVYSGALAIYYLGIHPQTRFRLASFTPRQRGA